MTFQTQGLIIREQHTGESDRIITVLTRDMGIIRAFANKSRRLVNKNASATQLLSYSNFGIYRSRDAYIVDNAESLTVFFSLREDIVSFSLSQYICELILLLAPQEEAAPDFLRLALLSLHMISNKKRPHTLVKAAFEMRLLSMAGYMPDLVCCAKCKQYQLPKTYFLYRGGILLCGDCHDKSTQSGLSISKGVLTALRHSIYADIEKLYSFSLPEDALKIFSQAAENYLLTHLDKEPITLKFYKSISNPA